MDVKPASVVYDKANKQTYFTVGGQRLTIPDYMTVADTQYYVNEHIDRLIRASLEFLSLQNSPKQDKTIMETAVDHYKSLGWDF